MDVLTAYAQLHPDKLALVDDRAGGEVRTFTFAELDATSNRLARVLADRGLGPGVKVAWCGQNSEGVVNLVHAARKIGATAVPVNYRFSDEEAAYVTDHSDAVVVYVDAELAPLFARIREQIPKVRTILVYDGEAPPGMESADELTASAPGDPLDAPDAEGAAATMIYTSGTTGRPKGALRVDAADPAQTAAMLQLIGYTPDDVYLTTGPLYHSGPSGFMGVAIALGQTIVLQRRFEPEDWLRLVETYRVTSTFSAPTPIRMVCNLPADVKDRFDRSSMRIMVANAAPWSFALKQQYVADFPADSLWEVYGSTELGVNTILRPDDQLRKPGSCGKEAPMVEIRLYDEDGNVVDGTGPEATGELYVRSPAVFADYYKQHDKFEEDNRDGWQTVGDIAYRDDDGFLYICDRKRDMVITGGMNVYPAEIEAALEEHPDVFEAAVFGIPSEEWGESVHAVIVKRPGSDLSEAAILAHAREHLAGYKVPRSIAWMEELPKTGSGKLLKRELRAPYWAGRTANV
jgi:acyl-CoA synthetase (AMP-forming)/AMP-acid ligase II